MAGLIQRAVNALYVSDTDTSRVRDNIVAAVNPVLNFLTNNFAQDNPVTTFLRGVLGSTAIFTGNVTSQSVNTGPVVSTSVNTGPIVSTSVTTGPLTATTTSLGTTTTGAITTGANVTNGAMTVNGASTLNGTETINGDTQINGNLYLVSRTTNGVVIMPKGGGPALYVTNAAGNSALWLVDDGGNGYGQAWQFTTLNCTTLTCNNLVDGAGIATTLDCGVYWQQNAAANTVYQTYKTVVNQNGFNGLGITPFIYKFTRAGSIIGYSLNNAGPVNGINYVRYVKNGTTLATLNVGTGANNATFWGTHNKGTYQFAAGDTLTTFVAIGTAGNYQASLILTLELSA